MSKNTPLLEPGKRQLALQYSYDAVAGHYASKIASVERKPFDLDALERFSQLLPQPGPVLDIGCGPGDVTAWLHAKNIQAIGLDLSASMLEEARRLHPDVHFQLGDIRNVSEHEECYAGLTAFYSLIHFATEELGEIVKDLRDALISDGLLLIALHVGDERIHLTDWFGETVDVVTFFHRPEAVIERLNFAGFEVVWSATREPYTEFEYPSQRFYILARRGSAAQSREPAASSCL